MLFEKDKGFVLHTKPYRDNSAIVQVLTLANGKLSFIVNGIRSAKSQKAAMLQPCQMLEISYILKNNFSRLTEIETLEIAQRPKLSDFIIFQYIHEILLKILPEQTPVNNIFNSYQKSLLFLTNEKVHQSLRIIEISLIEEFMSLPETNMVYGSNNSDNSLGEFLDSELSYYFCLEKGVLKQPNAIARNIKVDGSCLIAFSKLINKELNSEKIANLEDESIFKLAKPITSFLINQLLEGKPLKTKQVYSKLQKYI